MMRRPAEPLVADYGLLLFSVVETLARLGEVWAIIQIYLNVTIRNLSITRQLWPRCKFATNLIQESPST